MSAKRFGIEAGLVVVLLLAVAGVWLYKDHQMARQAEDFDQRAASLVVRAEEWASQIAATEAALVGRSFAAGIAPLVLGGRSDELDPAVVSLLTLKSVAFVHVLDGDGNVLASSDRKFISAGNVAQEAAWALDSLLLMTRPSERSGILEVATPVVGVSGSTRAYLWMGYNVAERLQTTRPDGLPTVGEASGGGNDGTAVGGAGDGGAAPAGDGAATENDGEESGAEDTEDGDAGNSEAPADGGEAV